MALLKVNAVDHIDPTGSVVGSGDQLATQVIELLKSGEGATVSFIDMHFVSSSYFNIFIRRVLDECGTEGLEELSLIFASPMQQQLFDRSRTAAVRALSKCRQPPAAVGGKPIGYREPGVAAEQHGIVHTLVQPVRQGTLFELPCDELLISVYRKQGRTLDDLPYTPQFESIYEAIVGNTHSVEATVIDDMSLMTRAELFHHLHNLRKAGKLPRMGRAAGKPPRVDPKHETLLTQLVEAKIGKLSLRDQLLYTPTFDDIVAAFNERAGLNLSAHDVWRVVAKLAK